MRLLLVLLLAGCSLDPTASVDRIAVDDDQPHHITNYVAQPLHPLNCGTPYNFAICPLPVRAPIKIEPLPFTSIMIEEIPSYVPSRESVSGETDEARTWVEK